MSILLDPRAVSILSAIRKAGGEPYITGGFVRDWLLEREPVDYDVEVFGLSEEDLKKLMPYFGAKVIGANFSVLDVRYQGLEMQFVAARRFFDNADVTIEQAAGRRDFSINAIYLNPFTYEIIDPYGGVSDLSGHILRRVNESFGDSPQRVLRGFQLAGRYRLYATTDTARACKGLLSAYAGISPDTVYQEWYKWATKSMKPSKGLGYLVATDWISLYPMLTPMLWTPQDPKRHEEGTVWNHTCMVVDEAVKIADRDGLSERERAILVFAALVHDIGKPETTVRQFYNGEVSITSHGHPEAGKEKARAFLASIGVPKAITDQAVALAANHMRFLDVNDSTTVRWVSRLATSIQPTTVRMLTNLIEADAKGRSNPGHIWRVDRVRELAAQARVQTALPKPLVTGKHLIERGFKEGPELGKILKRVMEAQLAGEFDTTDGGLVWLSNHI